MIIRESPKAKTSPDKNSANWPPKSPYEALLSSPSGRKKWQERNDRRQRTPSPSPQKGRGLAEAIQFDDVESGDEDAENEDEETLKLKLAAIQAKLKLKKLQAKAKQAESAPAAVLSSPRKRPRIDDDVQVPVSPVRVRTEVVEVTSPARVLLGIDKGWTAQDVSLKRPRLAGAGGQPQQHAFLKTPPRVKSFTERLAESRASDLEQQQKAERIQNARGHSFSLQALGAAAAPAPVPTPVGQQPSLLAEARARLGSTATPVSSTTGRGVPPIIYGPSIGHSTPSGQYSSDDDNTEDYHGTQRRAQRGRKVAARRPAVRKQTAAQIRAADAEALEPFSNVHLSKRQISHAQLADAFLGKELYPFPRLLKEVKSPHYDAPDCEADYVVFGIIASKSNPLDIKTTAKTAGDNSSATDRKFMVIHMTDFKWELDLFLFGHAFSKYWKISVGTVVAILNPEILPPRAHQKDSGKFSLKLTSAADAIIEIGQARDLGFCSSMRKDGTQCNDWIDKRSTQHCAFHINLQVEKTRSGRMEMATMSRAFAPDDEKNGKYIKSRWRAAEDPVRKVEAGKQSKYDFESGERYYMGPETSAAKLLDAADELNQPERMRKRLAEKEKEKTLRDKLAALGNGAGAAYLRAADPEAYTEDTEEVVEEKVDVDAKSLGLIARADQVRLSPVKGRKRPLDAGPGMGWAGAGKRGLLDKKPSAARAPIKTPGAVRMSSPERTQREPSPKKTRFTLDKGIRVPGRDSMVALDSSDDDLDIV